MSAKVHPNNICGTKVYEQMIQKIKDLIKYHFYKQQLCCCALWNWGLLVIVVYGNDTVLTVTAQIVLSAEAIEETK